MPLLATYYLRLTTGVPMPKLKPLCDHVFSTGRCCGSPALRDSNFCYWHHTARARRASRPAPPPEQPANSNILMPLVEDADSLMVSLQEVLHAIAENRIDRARAGLLLYGIQTSAIILPHLSRRIGNRVVLETISEGEDLTVPTPPTQIALPEQAAS
jgi:hypothetical protein